MLGLYLEVEIIVWNISLVRHQTSTTSDHNIINTIFLTLTK